jgi:hypothetical protein
MDDLTFTWDPDKAKTNNTKHGVSFEEARSVFYDENARLIFDPDHSETEDRFILLGLSAQLRLLVVSHTYRKDETVIRIISARRATKKEQRYYSGYLR